MAHHEHYHASDSGLMPKTILKIIIIKNNVSILVSEFPIVHDLAPFRYSQMMHFYKLSSTNSFTYF